MVEQIDDLIERTAPTGVGARFADARDMARVQKAIEKTSGVVGTDGNINGRKLQYRAGQHLQARVQAWLWFWGG